MQTMSLASFRRLLKASPNVYGYVRFTSDDGAYVKLIKADVLETIKNYHEDTKIEAALREDGLYIC